MRKWIFANLMLLSLSAHATLYTWNGTVDGRSDAASGSFSINGDLLWSMDLNVGPQHYVFLPQFFQFDANGLQQMSDVPLVGNNTSGDLQWNEKLSRWWFGTTEEDGMAGQIISVTHDAAPTPEPSSLILMGSALIGFLITRARWKPSGPRCRRWY